MEALIYGGHVIHCLDRPQAGPNHVEEIADGAVAVDEKGKIDGCGPRDELVKRFGNRRLVDLDGAIICPGFIDTHCHFPQLYMMGRWNNGLLDWLQTHTWTEEAKFADEAFSQQAAADFCQQLFRHGTTSAVVFSSVHKTATDCLFRQFEQHGMTAVIGKVSMDGLAPSHLCQDWRQDRAATEALISDWHGKQGRLFYALTPRFAPACSDQLMQSLGAMLRDDASLFVQTHHAENTDEIALVKSMFPQHRDYLSVYDHYHLLAERTVLAHCIHATDDEVAMIAARKCLVSHCPSSNFFLNSGVFGFGSMQASKVKLSLGSDIGGGTAFSMWKTMEMADIAAKLSQHPMQPLHWFYAATLGAARGLGLQGSIGSLQPGKEANFQVIDWRSHPLLKQSGFKGQSIEHKISSLIYHAEPQLVKRVVIAGKTVHGI